MSFQPDSNYPWSESACFTGWSLRGCTARAARSINQHVGFTLMIPHGSRAQPAADGWAVMYVLPDQIICFTLIRPLQYYSQCHWLPEKSSVNV